MWSGGANGVARDLRYIKLSCSETSRNGALAFITFQPESNVCFGGTGCAVEMTKLLKKILYVYDVQRNIWFWYRHDQDLFYACDQMSEEQFALPTFLPKTADFPDALLQLQDTSKRSLNIPARFM